jgi:hypothetical protein
LGRLDSRRRSNHARSVFGPARSRPGRSVRQRSTAQYSLNTHRARTKGAVQSQRSPQWRPRRRTNSMPAARATRAPYELNAQRAGNQGAVRSQCPPRGRRRATTNLSAHGADDSGTSATLSRHRADDSGARRRSERQRHFPARQHVVARVEGRARDHARRRRARGPLSALSAPTIGALAILSAHRAGNDRRTHAGDCPARIVALFRYLNKLCIFTRRFARERFASI